MRTFNDLKVGDFFYYSDRRKKVEKHKILRIKDDNFYRRYLVSWKYEGYSGTTDYIIPLDCMNTPYCHDWGMYVDPKYILEKINNEYENSTLDTE